MSGIYEAEGTYNMLHIFSASFSLSIHPSIYLSLSAILMQCVRGINLCVCACVCRNHQYLLRNNFKLNQFYRHNQYKIVSFYDLIDVDILTIGEWWEYWQVCLIIGKWTCVSVASNISLYRQFSYTCCHRHNIDT